jgi:hypothetical protein
MEKDLKDKMAQGVEERNERLLNFIACVPL